MAILNQVRGYHYLLGVFRNQQQDPFCGSCSAFVNTVKAAREGLAKLEADHADEIRTLVPPFAAFPAETRAGYASLRLPGNPAGQKKAGNCTLPPGVCFLKAALGTVRQA